MAKVSALEHLLPSGDTLWYVGPSLETGPMPALLYFSLSGEESLCLAPFNTPVQHLSCHPMRIFSLTLPAHGPGWDPTKALAYWGEQMQAGRNLLAEFLDRAHAVIDYLVQERIADPDNLAAAGLSRGGLIATHLAARDARIKAVCGFAPWVEPAHSKGWADSPAARNLSLFSLLNQLTKTAIRFYIGNRDIAVDTLRVCRFITELADTAYHDRVRSPHAELIVTPSIGHRGHGTPEQSFLAGAMWLKEQLGV